MRVAQGKQPREDERDPGPRLRLQSALEDLIRQVRRETGIRHADEIYPEPREWSGDWHISAVSDSDPPS
jgi:hypothetical protein